MRQPCSLPNFLSSTFRLPPVNQSTRRADLTSLTPSILLFRTPPSTLLDNVRKRAPCTSNSRTFVSQTTQLRFSLFFPQNHSLPNRRNPTFDLPTYPPLVSFPSALRNTTRCPTTATNNLVLETTTSYSTRLPLSTTETSPGTLFLNLLQNIFCSLAINKRSDRPRLLLRPLLQLPPTLSSTYPSTSSIHSVLPIYFT